MIYNPDTEEFVPTEAGETCLTEACYGSVKEELLEIPGKPTTRFYTLTCHVCMTVWNVRDFDSINYLSKELHEELPHEVEGHL